MKREEEWPPPPEPDVQLIDMLAADNKRMRNAGSKLSIAAFRVATEYDGVHRLMLAVQGWAKAIADEGGRDKSLMSKDEEEPNVDMSLEVRSCARCNQDHDIHFKQFSHPCEEYTHYGTCPITLEPVLMMILPDVDDAHTPEPFRGYIVDCSIGCEDHKDGYDECTARHNGSPEVVGEPPYHKGCTCIMRKRSVDDCPHGKENNL